MRRTDFKIWIFALLVGVILTISFQEPLKIISTFTAWCLVWGIWQVFSNRFVASDQSASKMSTDQAAGYLRLTIRRMLLTLVSALVLFLCVREFLGTVFWLSVAAYYQVGIALAVRDAWRSLKPLLASTNQV
jgi:hypothetical protein